jgi:hypothetical protein
MKKLLLTLGITALGLASAHAQSVTTWAGTGKAGSIPSAGVAKASAKLSAPYGIAKDSKGNTWVSCYDSTGQIYMINASGSVYSRVGQPTSAITSFHDGAASTAEMYFSAGIAVNKGDSIFFVDSRNSAIRMISPYKSVSNAQSVTTLAGGDGNLNSTTGGYGYQEGTGADYAANTDTKANKGALFQYPLGIAIDPVTGDIIVADNGNYVIRSVNKKTGKTTLIAGYPGGSASANGDPISAAHFFSPTGVFVDANRNIYVTEQSQQVRKITFDKTKNKYTDVSSIDIGKSPSPSYLSTFDIYPIAKAADGNFYLGAGAAIVKNTLSGTQPASTLIAGSGYYSNVTGGDSSGFHDAGGKFALFDQVSGILDISSSPTSKHLLVTDMANNRIRDINLLGSFTGIEDQANEADNTPGFRMYPNPANSSFTIENNALAGTQTSISMFDMTGKLVSTVITEFTGRYNMALGQYPNGIYIVKLQTPKESFTSRLIISK